MIYNTAYDTTALNGAQMRVTIEAIETAQHRDYLRRVDSTVLIDSMRDASAAIPAFSHPLYIGKRDPSSLHANNADNTPFLAVDIRNSGSYDDVKCEFVVKNSTIFKTKLYRAALTGVWLSQGPGAIRNLTPMATSVYASWMAETITRRYGLDPLTQYKLSILAAIFYTSNHMDGLQFDKAQENRYLAAITNCLSVKLQDVIDIYDVTGMISSIEDFCKKAKDVTGNVRIDELHHGVLIGITAGSWWGDNSAEVVAVALEHPPTWLSILLEAYTNTAMRKSPIAKICERRQYKDGLEMLVRAVKALAPGTAEMTARYK